MSHTKQPPELARQRKSAASRARHGDHIAKQRAYARQRAALTGARAVAIEQATISKAKDAVHKSRRNEHKAVTVLITLCVGLLVTYALRARWFGAIGFDLASYTFLLTIALDAVLMDR
jgi:hypothetical protein